MSIIKNQTYITILITIICIISLSSIFISPITAEEEETNYIGPAPEFVDDSLQVTVEPATDSDGNKMTQDARITYNITVKGELERNTFPYIMPVDLIVEEDNTRLDIDTIYLSPTQSLGFIPSYGEQEELENYQLRETFQYEISFDDQLEEDMVEDYMEREIDFILNSRNSNMSTMYTSNVEVDGYTPPGRNVQSNTLTQTTGVDEPSSVRNVDRFRISSSYENPQFLEDLSIVEPGGEFKGEISNFENVRETERDAAVIQSETDGLNFVTHTRDIPFEEPQTLSISYNLVSGDYINVTPIDSTGNEIDSNTNYTIPSNPSNSEHIDCTSSASTGDLCIFTLSEEETEVIKSTGELYLQYSSSDASLSSELHCQSMITGYYTSDMNACGGTGDIIDGNLISIDDFAAKNVGDDVSEYQSPTMQPDFNIEDLEENEIPEAEINLRTNITADIQEEQSLDVAIIEYNGISTEITDEIIIKDDVITIDNETDKSIEITKELKSTDLLKQYKAIICEEGKIEADTCTISNNIDTQRLDIIDEEVGENPNINTQNPFRLDLELNEDETESVVETREELETTDSDFEQSERGEEEGWNQIDEEEDWIGTIKEDVQINDVLTDDAEEYVTEAEEKLSDIEGGEWSDDFEYSISINSTETKYSTSSPGDEWELTTQIPERTMFDTINTQTNEIIDGQEYKNIIEQNSNTFVDRTQSNSFTSSDSLNVIDRAEDPDNCLNCYPTETINDGQEQTNQGEEIISTPDDEPDIWEKVSDEPISEETITGEVITYEWRDSDLEDGFERIYQSDDSEDLWMDIDFETVDVYRWEQTNKQIPLIEFSTATYTDVSKWQKTTYDIEYEFTGEVDEETELYTYQRDIEQLYEEWIPEIKWFDLYNSHTIPEDEKQLSHVEVKLPDMNEELFIDWDENIHGNESLDETICDSNEFETDTVYTTDDSTLMKKYCNIDNEKVITNFGVEYYEPGTYETELTMYDDVGLSSTETITGYVNEGPGIPEIEEINSVNKDESDDNVNNRFNYLIDNLAFEGSISANNPDLDERYYLSVSPATSYASLNACPEGYSEETVLDLQSQTQTTDTFTELTKCTWNAFIDTDELVDEFTLYEIENNETNYTEIPEGTIQQCLSPLEQNDNGECIAPNDEEVEFIEDNEYQSINSEKLEQQCPYGYEQTMNDNETQAYCEIEQEPEFNLKTNQKSIDYDSIQSGVIQECEEIPVSSENNNHNGYIDTSSNSDIAYCELVDDSDIGPSGFTLYEIENIDGEEIVDYNSPPAGAVRGQTFLENSEDSEYCENYRITENNKLKCEYTEQNENLTIQYGQQSQSDTIPINNEITNMNSEDNENIIWESDFIVDDNEEFIHVENPRELFDETDTEKFTDIIEFEFNLINQKTGIVDSETVEIDLCKAPESSTLPNEPEEDEYCDGFDTIMNNEPDFIGERTTIDDELSNVDEDDLPIELEIKTVKNDACPYVSTFPRNQDEITPVSISIDSEDNLNRNYVEEEIDEKLQSRYGINSLCSIEINDPQPSEDPSSPITPPSLTSGESSEDEIDNLIDFYFDSFGELSINEEYFTTETYNYTIDFENIYEQEDDFIENMDNLRHAGLSDLTAQFDVVDSGLNPRKRLFRGQEDNEMFDITQSRWTQDDIGDMLRFGQTVNTDLEDNLIAAYTFDHNSNIVQQENIIGTSSRTPYTDYDIEHNMYKVEDVIYGSEVGENDIHHARIWFGSSCGGMGTTNHQDWNTNLEDDEYNRITFSDGCEYGDERVDREDLETNIDDTFSMYQSQVNNIGLDNPIGEPNEDIDNQTAYVSTFEDTDETNVGNELFNMYDDSGIFGGSALNLNQNTWMMLSPPFINDELIEEEGSVFEYDGTGSKYQDEFLSDIYQNVEIDENILSDEIARDDYTISFWAKDKDSLYSGGHQTANIFSIPLFDPDTGGLVPSVTTAELNYMNHPLTVRFDEETRENISDIFGEDVIEELEIGLPNSRNSAYTILANQNINLEHGDNVGLVNFENGIGWGLDYSLFDRNDDVSTYYQPIPNIRPNANYQTTLDENYLQMIRDNIDSSGSDIMDRDYVVESRDDTDSWTHIAISRNEDDENYRIYRDGDIVSNPSFDKLHSEGDDIRGDIEIDIGQISQQAGISFGAVKRHPTTRTSDYEPIIQANEGDILIDELRVYDEAIDELDGSGPSIDELSLNEISDTDNPAIYDIDGEFSTNSIEEINGEEISTIAEESTAGLNINIEPDINDEMLVGQTNYNIDIKVEICEEIDIGTGPGIEEICSSTETLSFSEGDSENYIFDTIPDTREYMKVDVDMELYNNFGSKEDLIQSNVGIKDIDFELTPFGDSNSFSCRDLYIQEEGNLHSTILTMLQSFEQEEDGSYNASYRNTICSYDMGPDAFESIHTVYEDEEDEIDGFEEFEHIELDNYELNNLESRDGEEPETPLTTNFNHQDCLLEPVSCIGVNQHAFNPSILEDRNNDEYTPILAIKQKNVNNTGWSKFMLDSTDTEYSYQDLDWDTEFKNVLKEGLQSGESFERTAGTTSGEVQNNERIYDVGDTSKCINSYQTSNNVNSSCITDIDISGDETEGEGHFKIYEVDENGDRVNTQFEAHYDFDENEVTDIVCLNEESVGCELYIGYSNVDFPSSIGENIEEDYDYIDSIITDSI